jgi:predicted nucleotidyltransferase component of viral defense system
VKISKEKLLQEAEVTGFRPDILEKSIYLLSLLESLRAHPFLKERLVLKGGTALNLFHLNLPQLSIDIDLNYIGSSERAVTLSERPEVERGIQAVCQREGFHIRKIPSAHARGRFSLRYQSAMGQDRNLSIDVNFMFRTPLWSPVVKDSWPLGSYQARDILVLDIHELTGGKLRALFSRHTARDLFDAHELLTKNLFQKERLRLAFVLYVGMMREDWRDLSLEAIHFDSVDLKNNLIPLLQVPFIKKISREAKWAPKMVKECQKALSIVFPFSDSERKFLTLLTDKGEIQPSLLVQDSAMQDRIQNHPALLWKVQNVREFKGR